MGTLKIRVLKASKNELELEIEGEGHTLLNALVDELNRLENVKFAAYAIDHPEFPVARLRVVTEGISPIDALALACDSISARSLSLKELFRKEFGVGSA